jgi:hypothetical protein
MFLRFTCLAGELARECGQDMTLVSALTPSISDSRAWKKRTWSSLS